MQDLDYILKSYCKDRAGFDFIERGDYQLIRSQDSKAMNARLFPAMVKPEAVFETSIVLELNGPLGDYERICPRCRHSNKTVVDYAGWIECDRCSGHFLVEAVTSRYIRSEWDLLDAESERRKLEFPGNDDGSFESSNPHNNSFDNPRIVSDGIDNKGDFESWYARDETSLFRRISVLCRDVARTNSRTTQQEQINRDTEEAHIPPDSNIERWFNYLLYRTEGVLFEDRTIQIGLKSNYRGYLGKVAIYVGNKTATILTSINLKISSNSPESLSVSTTHPSGRTIGGRSQVQWLLDVECKAPFTETPSLRMSFASAAGPRTPLLKLPVVVTKFMNPVSLDTSAFFAWWKLIGGPPRNSQGIFPIDLTTGGGLDSMKYRRVITGNGVSVLDEIDPNKDNIVGAGVVQSSAEGKVGCLLRLEPNREAQLCRLTVRSESETVSREVQNLVSASWKLERRREVPIMLHLIQLHMIPFSYLAITHFDSMPPSSWESCNPALRRVMLHDRNREKPILLTRDGWRALPPASSVPR